MGDARRGLEACKRRGDDLDARTGEARIARLRGFVRRGGKVARHRQRRVDAVAGEHGAGVGEGGRVGDRRPRSDDARVVAGHVGDEEAHRLRRKRRGREPAALDGGEMLPHRVHRRDVGAGREQRPVHRLLLLEADPLRRQREQRRSAAGDEAEHQIVRPGALGEREDAAGGVASARVRDRVRRLDDLDPLAGDAVSGAGDDQAFERAVPDPLHRARHGGRGFARAENDGAAYRALRQVLRHHLRRQRRGDGCVEEGPEEGAGVGHGGLATSVPMPRPVTAGPHLLFAAAAAPGR